MNYVKYFIKKRSILVLIKITSMIVFKIKNNQIVDELRTPPPKKKLRNAYMYLTHFMIVIIYIIMDIHLTGFSHAIITIEMVQRNYIHIVSFISLIVNDIFVKIMN